MDQKTIDELKKLVEIQGRPGNYDYSDYMLGIYNGMELMLATIEGRDPVYRSLGEVVGGESKIGDRS